MKKPDTRSPKMPDCTCASFFTVRGKHKPDCTCATMTRAFGKEHDLDCPEHETNCPDCGSRGWCKQHPKPGSVARPHGKKATPEGCPCDCHRGDLTTCDCSPNVKGKSVECQENFDKRLATPSKEEELIQVANKIRNEDGYVTTLFRFVKAREDAAVEEFAGKLKNTYTLKTAIGGSEQTAGLKHNGLSYDTWEVIENIERQLAERKNR